MQRQTIANFDNEGIIVYQAFNASIAEEAVRLGILNFADELSSDRLVKLQAQS